jgi:putative FmdB family regulatory protein
MPIYEYECNQCGRIEEAIQKISDRPLKKCRHCSGKLHKLVSQSTFHLKGTGWYVTDYANKSTSAPSASKNKKAEAQKTDAKTKTEQSKKTTE